MTEKTYSNGKNRGFTVIEMLVSVAILVMVIGPLLGGFIVSQRITTKGYYLGEASLVSRNIIETIRAEGVEAFLAQNGLTPNATGVYDIDITGFDSSEIKNVRVGIGASMFFDARVRIDADAYRNPDYPDVPGAVPDFNDHLITDYLPMDAVFVQPRDAGLDPDVLALEDFKGELSLLGIPLPSDLELSHRLKRVITLDVQRVGANNLSMTVTYEYQLTQLGGLSYSVINGINARVPDHPTSIYDEALEFDDEDNPLPIVAYLFYIPYYAPLVTAPADTIVVNNLDDLPLNVFIVKQRPDDLTLEEFYNATIIQGEAEMRFDYVGLDKSTRIFSNFRENFAGGSPAGPFETWVRYGDARVPSDPESELLVAQSARARMFAITIDVYHAGELGGNPIYSYDATHLE